MFAVSTSTVPADRGQHVRESFLAPSFLPGAEIIQQAGQGGGSSDLEAGSYCESERRPVQCLVTVSTAFSPPSYVAYSSADRDGGIELDNLSVEPKLPGKHSSANKFHSWTTSRKASPEKATEHLPHSQGFQLTLTTLLALDPVIVFFVLSELTSLLLPHLEYLNLQCSTLKGALIITYFS
ncbi:hypothetical protein PFLUV_G00008160 [Perca fluviatilis]|uniref:Uncharacterized protein n=1 Tax=Perca fluviatilis TaxID=8168 RepID=A0A6A5F0Y4_PERFL|nr:hypothetical protein PFLUV_G00008160 [Perca fluviatilis]